MQIRRSNTAYFKISWPEQNGRHFTDDICTTWINNEKMLRRHMVTLSHNELPYMESMIEMTTLEMLYFHQQDVHDGVIKRKHFPRYWPIVRGIHRSPVNSPHKGQWRGALMFSLICVWINDWVNNGAAGDLRRYRPHYDVTVMVIINLKMMNKIYNTVSKAIHCLRLAVFFMMTSSNGNIFRATLPLCEGFTGHQWIPHKGQWRGALIFSFICAWING